MKGETMKLERIAILMWAIGVLFCLAFWAGVIFLALHFIGKFW